MFDNLIQPNPTINFNALVNALFPDQGCGISVLLGLSACDLADEIVQTLEQGELSYGDNCWYCDVHAFLSMMEIYLQQNGVWIDPRHQRIYDAITELQDAGKIHLIDLSN